MRSGPEQPTRFLWRVEHLGMSPHVETERVAPAIQPVIGHQIFWRRGSRDKARDVRNDLVLLERGNDPQKHAGIQDTKSGNRDPRRPRSTGRRGLQRAQCRDDSRGDQRGRHCQRSSRKTEPRDHEESDDQASDNERWADESRADQRAPVHAPMLKRGR